MKTGALTALGAAAIIAVAVVAWPGTSDVGPERPRPAAPADLPRGAVPIEVGDGPVEVAVGDGAIWVSNVDDSTISRIDSTTNEVTLSVNLSGAPGDLAVGRGGEVWIASRDLGMVQRIDGVTTTTTPDLRVDVGPADTSIDLAIDDYLWVAAVERELLQVDPATGDIVRRIDYVRPVNVAAKGGNVFVLEADGTVRGIDQLTGEPTAIELRFDLSGRGDIHYYDGVLWVAEGDGSTLYSVDLAQASQRIRSYPFRGTYVEMVEVDAGILVLSDLGDDTGVLSLVDAGTGETTELIEIPGAPGDLVRGLDDLWVSIPSDDAVLRLPSLP